MKKLGVGRWRHDDIKLCIINICNDSKVRAEAEVFGRFRDLLPPHLFAEGGQLHHGRQRVGLTPDLLLRLPTPDGVTDRLGEIKAMSAGVSRYPASKTEKQADRRAKELPGTYRRPLEKLDREVRGTPPGETGALVARLQGFGELLCLVEVPGGTVLKIYMLSSKPVLRARSTTFAGQLVGQSWSPNSVWW